jgi:Flp pilus assembly protein TadG
MFDNLRKITAKIATSMGGLGAGLNKAMPNVVRLAKSKTGIAGVEFAMLAPVLIGSYFATFELTVALSVTGRVNRATSTIADLVAAQRLVDKNYLASMDSVTESIMAPFTPPATRLLKISGIAIDDRARATVAWSWDSKGNRPYTQGSRITIPEDVRVPNTFLIRSELAVPYATLFYFPDLALTQISNATLKKEYFFSPRLGYQVTCKDC